METKEKILEAALELFSVNGYDGVSVAQIGEAVGIKAPSLYKHYKNKQAIFDAILERMQERYAQQASELHLDDMADTVFGAVTEEHLTQMVLQLFHFFLSDPYMEKFRRMMILEQYRNPQIGELYRRQYFDDPIRYQTKIFRTLIEAGILREEDPEAVAVAFYSPIFMQLTICDHYPERISQAENCIRKHLRQFNNCYRKENEI